MQMVQHDSELHFTVGKLPLPAQAINRAYIRCGSKFGQSHHRLSFDSGVLTTENKQMAGCIRTASPKGSSLWKAGLCTYPVDKPDTAERKEGFAIT
jgi:hypothetical protein